MTIRRHYLSIGRLACLFVLLHIVSLGVSQVGINETGAAPHPSSVLDISADDKGFLGPVLTYAQRITLAPASLTEGLLVYQEDDNPSFPRGFYQLLDPGSGLTWVRVGAKQTYRGSIIMGASPILASGDLPGASLSTISTGVMRVDIPGLGSDAIVQVSPEFLATGTPPLPPGDYCVNSFSGNCATGGYYNSTIYITQPVGEILSSTGFNMDIFLHHAPPAASCNNANGDYIFHNNTSALSNPAFGFFGAPHAWAGTFSAPPFIGNDINSLAAGSQFDLTMSGNFGAANISISAFIDWNQDGDFFDMVDGISEALVYTPVRTWPPAAPTVASGPTSSTGTVWTIDIPPSAVNGKTVLRTIHSNLPNNQNPCIISNQGSTRDYAFVVSGGSTPSYPGESRICNVFDQNSSGFEVRCYQSRSGAPVDDRFYLLINPQ